MIQFFKMSQYKIIILLFFLFTAKSVIAADPFDNTIFTFDNDIPTTDQLDQPILTQNSDSSSVNGEVALDQPINTRYPITRYSLQGVIKSMNQTRMMFVSSEENTKFLLSVKDCLGLNCAYVTDIDKRGVITFEDDEGIYRFQVGYAPYIVEQKITDESEESGEDIIAINDSEEAEIESTSDEAVSELNIAETKIGELEKENLSLLATVELLTNSNEAYQDTIAVQEQDITQLEENINQLQAELQNISSTNNDVSKLEEAEKNIINLEQTIKEKEDEINRLNTELLDTELQNMSPSADTSTNENDADLDNLQNIINNLNEDIDRKNNLLKESAKTISSQVNQITILENKLNDLTDQNSDVLESENNNEDGAEESTEEEGVVSVTENDDATTSDSDVLESENNNEDGAEESTEEEGVVSVTENDDAATSDSDVSESNSDNIMIAKEDVNIREKPSPHSSIIGVLLQNAEVSVLDNVQGWYQVSLDDGKIGYIYTPMLKEKN